MRKENDLLKQVPHITTMKKIGSTNYIVEAHFKNESQSLTDKLLKTMLETSK